MILPLIFRLARQRHHFYSSPARSLRILADLAANLPRQIEILRVLARPVFAGLLRANPILPFKFLTRGFLARELTVAQRASGFAHHYRQLDARFPPDKLRQIFDAGLPLHEMHDGANEFAIVLGLPTDVDREGELALKLTLNGELIYVLQFTIVPGPVAGSDAAETVLISRIQGVKGRYLQIRSATKTFNEVAPAALLVTALAGMAQAWKIGEMAGVSATGQFCYDPAYGAVFEDAYDTFFQALGATRAESGFYRSPLPLREKPLDLVKNGHKARTREKRAFRRKIAREVCQMIQRSCLEACVQPGALAFGVLNSSRS